MPSFHDGEITSLELHRNAPSYLRVHGFAVNVSGSKMDWKNAKHAIVTFELQQIVDLQLDGFSHQNVIGSLIIERKPSPFERVNYVGKEDAAALDFELTLEPCFGLDGRNRALASVRKPAPLHLPSLYSSRAQREAACAQSLNCRSHSEC